MSKAQLMKARTRLTLAQQGYELLDKKIWVLTRNVEEAKGELAELTRALETALMSGRAYIKAANLEVGYAVVSQVPKGTWVEEMPQAVDQARACFEQVKALAVKKAMALEALMALEEALKTTTIRANALDYQVIPRQKRLIDGLTHALEEGEREALIRVALQFNEG